jgi:hypothetical protein
MGRAILRQRQNVYDVDAKRCQVLVGYSRSGGVMR